MNGLQSYLHNFAFNVYPYICLAVFLMGSLARFDRDQYTWKSDSSQLLRAGQLRWGSNLFHGGILFLFFNRWRPANDTYLFGFRKHEQGNNAVEIPKFDPLIEEKEKEIWKLSVPVKRSYKLAPASK